MSYQKAGVDIQAADLWVEKIKNKVRKTHGPQVTAAVGGYASLFSDRPGHFVASSTDGVGTKIRLACELGEHRGIGIDVVAMCVNDLICVGATPWFFLDYIAIDRLDDQVLAQIMDGMVDGCLQSKMALVGGETAQMPGFYQPGEYDVAGFCVGGVEENDLLGGPKVKPGDRLYGVSSSGFHSNGFSWIRKILSELPENLNLGYHGHLSLNSKKELIRELLTPTIIYVDLFHTLKMEFQSHLKGMAHITGSGFLNIPRMNEELLYFVETTPSMDEIPPIYKIMLPWFDTNLCDLYRTFNMGVGLAVVISPQVRSDQVLKVIEAQGLKGWPMGEVKAPRTKEEQGQVWMDSLQKFL